MKKIATVMSGAFNYEAPTKIAFHKKIYLVMPGAPFVLGAIISGNKLHSSAVAPTNRGFFSKGIREYFPFSQNVETGQGALSNNLPKFESEDAFTKLLPSSFIKNSKVFSGESFEGHFN